MHRTERIRQSASGQLTWDEIQKLQNQGWRLIALESMGLYQTVRVNRERHVEFVLRSKDLKGPIEQ